MILDTNAVSAAGFGDRTIAAILAQQKALYMPVIVIGEYRYGLLGSSKRIETEKWFSAFISTTLVLDINRRTALYYAEIFRALKRARKPIPTNDVWIASLAIEHDLPLLTRDVHFDLVPHLRRQPW